MRQSLTDKFTFFIHKNLVPHSVHKAPQKKAYVKSEEKGIGLSFIGYRSSLYFRLYFIIWDLNKKPKRLIQYYTMNLFEKIYINHIDSLKKRVLRTKTKLYKVYFHCETNALYLLDCIYYNLILPKLLQ